MSDVVLKVEFRHKDPVELISFSNSMASFSTHYQRFVIESSRGRPFTKDARLYISKIESGSIITHLVDLLPVAMGFMDANNTIVDFSKHLKDVFDFYLGRTSIAPNLDKPALTDIAQIVNPTARDRSSQFNIQTLNVKPGAQVNIHINTTEANAIQNRISQDLKKNDLLNDGGSSERVLFYWFQARKNVGSKTGFLGVVESISKKPLRVIFGNDEIASEMLGYDDRNPLKLAYVVDVSVETIRNKPAAYKVLKVHNSFLQGQ